MRNKTSCRVWLILGLTDHKWHCQHSEHCNRSITGNSIEKADRLNWPQTGEYHVLSSFNFAVKLHFAFSTTLAQLLPILHSFYYWVRRKIHSLLNKNLNLVNSVGKWWSHLCIGYNIYLDMSPCNKPCLK